MSKKGQNWERDMSRDISEWWSKCGDDDLFWHTHGSGARATTRAKRGKKTRGQYGDIAAVDSRGATLLKAMTISLKRGYQQISLQDVCDIVETAKTHEFRDWIKECIAHSRQAGAIGWMLLMKKDRREIMCFVPLSMVFALNYKTRGKLLKHSPCVLFRLRTRDNKQADKAKKKSAKSYMRWYLKNNALVLGIKYEIFKRLVTRADICEMVKVKRANKAKG